MNNFTYPVQVRWADIDANRHLRHSVYYDYAASMRMELLQERGLTAQKFETFMMGPILFREEAIFKREILFQDSITLDVALIKATADFGRWSFRHNFYKADKTLAAIVNVDGAWIDLAKRKLAQPNEFIREIFEAFPKAEEFTAIDSKKTTP